MKADELEDEMVEPEPTTAQPVVLSDLVDGPGDHSVSTLVPMPGWTAAPQIVPARNVWRIELGQQLPGERKARRRAG